MKKYTLKSYYIVLLLLIGILNFFGILILKSASNNSTEILNKQILESLIGFVFCMGISLFNYDLYKKFSFIIYAGVLFILAAVLLWGATHNGAGRWIVLPVLGQIQPAEFAKAGLIIFFGVFLDKNSENLNQARTFITILFYFIIPVVLIFLEPNLSMTILIGVIFVSMLFCAGLSLRITLICALIAAALIGGILFLFNTDGYKLIPFIEDYQKERILSFLNPDEYRDSTYFQQANSLMAIGSGGFFGKGLFNTDITSVKAGNFLIEEDTDFIFAIIGEELGFRGCVLLFILFLMIILCILVIAGQAKDIAGRVICVGAATWIGFQAFTNIAVATAIFPNTGVPLPFISKGGSSLLALYIIIGVVLNISLQTKDI